MTQEIQSEKEMTVFKKFLNTLGINYSHHEIEKLDPPSPDIRWKNGESEDRTFELVEFLDQGFKSKIEFAKAAESKLYKQLDVLPGVELQGMKENYGDCDILVNFHDGCSQSQLRNTIPNIFKELLVQPKGFEGVIENIQNMKQLKNVLSISVNRCGINGPLFNVETVGSVGDPCIDAIANKFNKKYETKFSIELLAYIENNPMFPDDVWKPKLSSYLKSCPSLGQFSKIWVFDILAMNIPFVWPTN